MKKDLPQFPKLKLVATVYGDDLADKSYRETKGLINSYPNLKAIVAPTSVGIVAAAQAVSDMGKTGKIYVTGLGLPSELAGHVESGAVKSFAIWNPIDLGYAATMIAHDLVKGTATDKEASMGRIRITSYNVCYTKLLRPRAFRSLPFATACGRYSAMTLMDANAE